MEGREEQERGRRVWLWDCEKGGAVMVSNLEDEKHGSGPFEMAYGKVMICFGK